MLARLGHPSYILYPASFHPVTRHSLADTLGNSSPAGRRHHGRLRPGLTDQPRSHDLAVCFALTRSCAELAALLAGAYCGETEGDQHEGRLTKYLINMSCPTSWFPGVLHAFYLLWVYSDQRERYKMGARPLERAPFVYSEKVQTGGLGGYSTIVKPPSQYSAS